MKKLMMLFAMLCIVVSTTQAQNYILRSYSAFYKNTKTGLEQSELPSDVLIVVDIENDLIKIDNEFNDVFYIRSIEKQTTEYDGDGDQYKSIYLSAYDNEGARCTVNLSIWEDYNIVVVGAIYKSIFYGYHCKIINQ